MECINYNGKLFVNFSLSTDSDLPLLSGPLQSDASVVCNGLHDGTLSASGSTSRYINIDNEHRVSLCAVSVAAIKWSIFELQRQKTYAWKGLDALRIRIDFLNA